MDRQESTATTAPSSRPGEQRIPSLLQAVFLKSNRGKEVKKPPPGKVASREFFRNWFSRRGQSEQKKRGYFASKDKVLTKNQREGSKKGSSKKVDDADAGAAAETILNADAKMETFSLQEYFEALLKERGYDIKLYETLNTGYYTKATAIQIASYGPRMIQIVRTGDVPALRETMAVGLSSNPSNQFGESLLHMVCRHGDLELMDVLIDAGASLQVSDDYGRTPLNDALWAPTPAYGVVKRILDQDSGLLFLKDRRGSLPLEYVVKSDRLLWRDWLDQHVDVYFPEAKANCFGSPELANMEPNSVALPEHKTTGLPLDLIKMVASGSMTPEEARTIAQTFSNDDETEISDDDYDSEYDSDFDSDDESLYGDLEQTQMLEILQFAEVAKDSAE